MPVTLEEVHGIQADCYAEDVRIYWPRMEAWDAPSVREYFESGGTSFPTAVPKAEANAEESEMAEEKPDKVKAEHEEVAEVLAKVEAVPERSAVPERLAVIAAKEAAEEAKVEAVTFVAAVVKAAEEAKAVAAKAAAVADPFDIPLPRSADPFDVPLSGSGTPRGGPQVSSPARQPPSDSPLEPWSFTSLSESLSESPLELPSSAAAADGQQFQAHGHEDEEEVVDVPLGTPQAEEGAGERTDAHVPMVPPTPPAAPPLSFFQRLFFSCGPIHRAPPPSNDGCDVVTTSM